MQEPDQRPRNQPEAEVKVAWTRSAAINQEGEEWTGLRDAEEAEAGRLGGWLFMIDEAWRPALARRAAWAEGPH